MHLLDLLEVVVVLRLLDGGLDALRHVQDLFTELLELVGGLRHVDETGDVVHDVLLAWSVGEDPPNRNPGCFPRHPSGAAPTPPYR